MLLAGVARGGEALMVVNTTGMAKDFTGRTFRGAKVGETAVEHFEITGYAVLKFELRLLK